MRSHKKWAHRHTGDMTQLMRYLKRLPMLPNIGEPGINRLAKQWDTARDKVYGLITKVLSDGSY
ncbi:hypothetical protein [Parapedobacter soli]|uniref:hypothetical protein n=1 Tax=Parapedobacter soli TaxID=416955 RepID=UPI0021C77A05|nr:hypothetical protein [Parapedobacter soli]